jgi:hypothetical protein
VKLVNPIPILDVSDVAASLGWFEAPRLGERRRLDRRKAVELGYEIVQPPTDEPWRMREFHLRHPDGHVFRVSAESGG